MLGSIQVFLDILAAPDGPASSTVPQFPLLLLETGPKHYLPLQGAVDAETDGVILGGLRTRAPGLAVPVDLATAGSIGGF
ncbi:MAG: hypothetical protein GY696_06510 [Gammaproteobacteria bacterium]|nr:hypothetical protein [Gammaproteobacteria bacterium]